MTAEFGLRGRLTQTCLDPESGTSTKARVQGYLFMATFLQRLHIPLLPLKHVGHETSYNRYKRSPGTLVILSASLCMNASHWCTNMNASHWCTNAAHDQSIQQMVQLMHCRLDPSGGVCCIGNYARYTGALSLCGILAGMRQIRVFHFLRHTSTS